MTPTIKITNPQGQEEEWEEIGFSEMDNLSSNIQSIEFWDGEKHKYYKKLPPKEVYPKCIEEIIWAWFFSRLKQGLKQALAESERIQSHNYQQGVDAKGEDKGNGVTEPKSLSGEDTSYKTTPTNIQNKTEEKKA